MSTTALLIIDMQKAMFLHPKKQPYRGEEVLNNIRYLLGKARENHTPVIFIQHTTQGDYKEGTLSWEICSEIQPKPEETIVQKTTPDAFYNTGLDEVLNQKQIEHLIVMGMQSDCCVQATCKGALSHGYQVTLVSDANTTFSRIFVSAKHAIEKVSRDLSEKGVHLSPAKEIFT